MVRVEPLSVLTSLGIAFARAAGGKIGASVAAQLGMTGEALVSRLASIEGQLAAMQLDSHGENLRRGIALLRESSFESDIRERDRRLRVAEDGLVVAASDTQLAFDDRATAAILAAVCCDQRGSQADVLRWLWISNAYVNSFVADRLYHEMQILGESAPPHIRKAIEEQRRATNPITKFFVGERLSLDPLRHRLRTEAHSVLPAWSAIREALNQREPSILFSAPEINNDTHEYQPGPQENSVLLHTIFTSQFGKPSAGGASVLTVSDVSYDAKTLRVAGSIVRQPHTNPYQRPNYFGTTTTQRLWIGTQAVYPYESGAFPNMPRSGNGKASAILIMPSVKSQLSFYGEYTTRSPADTLLLWTDECEYEYDLTTLQ